MAKLIPEVIFGTKIPKSVVFTAITALSAYLIYKKSVSRSRALEKLKEDRKSRLIVITGCDSGLGYSMAIWAAKLGYKVLAGCLRENGEGGQKLQRQFPDNVIVAGLDVTDARSLTALHSVCKEVLERHEGQLRLWAIIANAAVCTMGEFFWQTQNLREQQMNVNFWGTVNFVTEFRTLLFETKARVIVISSDCSDYPLPYLSTYGASKAALNNWAQSFRFEVAKYGVSVVSYQPRDFATKSGLFSSLESDYQKMKDGMSNAEKEFYGEYFPRFMERKKEFFGSNPKSVKPLDSEHHKTRFLTLLESDVSQISVYIDFSWMEKTFHTLYKALPQRYVDALANKLLNPQSIRWRKTCISAE